MAKLDFLQAEYAPRITAILKKDETADKIFGYALKDADENEVFADFAAKVDPTHNRGGSPFKYLAWVCRCFCATPNKAEDLYKIHNDLRDFDMWSAKLAADKKPNQIQNISSFTELQRILLPYQNARAAKHSRLQRTQETTVVYEGPEGKIVMPHTMAACQYWGQQTRWCISATSSVNRFSDYHEKYPIFVYIPKVPAEEKALWYNFSSFKFASVDGKVWNELDNVWPSAPTSLKKLAVAAEEHLTGTALAFFRQHNPLDDIKAMNPQPSVNDDGEDIPEHPLWAQRKNEIAKAPNGPDARHLTEENFYNDRNFALYLIKKHSYLFARIPSRYRDDEEIALAAISDYQDCFKDVSERLKHDRDFVIKAVRKNRYILSHADKKWQADRDVMLAAMDAQNGYGSPLEDAYPPTHINDNFLKRIFNFYAAPLLAGLPNLRNDDVIALAAMQKRPDMSYPLLSRRLRNDEALYAMTKGYGYKHAPYRLRADKTRLLEAVEATCGRAFEYAPRYFRRDKQLILELVQKWPCIVDYMPNSYKRDRDFALELVKRNGEALKYLKIEKFSGTNYLYRDDREICFAAVQNNGCALQFVDYAFQNDREMVLAAVAQNGSAAAYAHSLMREPDFLRQAIELNYTVIPAVQCWPGFLPDYISADRNLALRGIEQNAKNFSSMHPYLRADREIAMKALAKDKSLLDKVHENLFKDITFVCAQLKEFKAVGQLDAFLPYLRFLPSLQGEIEAVIYEHLKESKDAGKENAFLPYLRFLPSLWGSLDVFTDTSKALQRLDRPLKMPPAQKHHKVSLAQ